MSGALDLSDLELPEGFALQAELPTVVGHVAREHDFRPNLIVTAQPLAEGPSFEAWVDSNLAEQLGLLTAPPLIDRERQDGSTPAERTLIRSRPRSSFGHPGAVVAPGLRPRLRGVGVVRDARLRRVRRLVRLSRGSDRREAGMSTTPQIDPETGVVLLSEHQWEELLVSHRAGDQTYPELAPALSAATRPAARIALARGKRRCLGWIEGTGAFLMVPRDQSLIELVPLSPAFLPDAVARLVELGPRPRTARETLRPRPADLALALAGEAPLPGLAPVERHWELELTGNGDEPLGSIEVLDTADGLWVVEPHEAEVAIRPSDATAVWRRLSALVRLISEQPQHPGG
jgi:hypothetical protein